jgi:hypothetical protein
MFTGLLTLAELVVLSGLALIVLATLSELAEFKDDPSNARSMSRVVDLATGSSSLISPATAYALSGASARLVNAPAESNSRPRAMASLSSSITVEISRRIDSSSSDGF